PAGAVGRALALGYDALQVELAGAPQHRLPAAGEMLNVADRTRPAPSAEQGLESRLAGQQRLAAQIPALCKQDIEGEEHQGVGLALREGRLQGREIGRA